VNELHLSFVLMLNYQIYHFNILLYEILVLKKVLVKLCVRNYQTSNVLVNDVDGIFKFFIKTISQSLT
jgi:hypothetical protein